MNLDVKCEQVLHETFFSSSKVTVVESVAAKDCDLQNDDCKPQNNTRVSCEQFYQVKFQSFQNEIIFFVRVP